MIRRIILIAIFSLIAGQAYAARDAAFLSPNQGMGAGRSDEAVTVEPKSEIDVGETALNVGRKTTLFFVNQTGTPIDIKEITAGGDANVRATIVDDDCTKLGKITPSSRCSVTVEVTPVGSGPWTTEVLMTHSGAGRITRVKLSGKTSGGTSADKRDPGLSLSTKDVKPVDFGDLDAGTGQAVRSALMINDSGETIKLLSIEVIAAQNGLQKLDQGCEPEQELKPGESCPVTLLWKPEAKGLISTDLIIRHTGPLGFVVIPVRGKAKEDFGMASTGTPGKSGTLNGKPSLSPTADDLEKALAGHLNPVTASGAPSLTATEKKDAAASTDIHLIGTVGNRAVIYLPNGSTSIVALGESIPLEGTKAVLTNVMAREAEVLINGKKKTLPLEAVSALTNRVTTRAPASSPTPTAQGYAKEKVGDPFGGVPVLDKGSR